MAGEPGPISGFGNQWLDIWGLKVLLDGGVEGGYFREPYANNPQFRGFPFLTQEHLEALVEQAHGLGWRVGLHVVGTPLWRWYRRRSTG